MSIVERQHYVWRRYLTAWCVGNTVWCSRFKEGALFPSNPINLAVERYFYGLTDLTEEDVQFVRAFVVDRVNNAELRKLNIDWISHYEVVFALVRELRDSNADNTSLLEQIATLLTQIEEQALGDVEQSANEYLDSLICGDVSFYDDPDQASKFLIFLTQQYFRTKKIRDAVLERATVGVPASGMDRAWPIMRRIFATNVGACIFAKRATMKLCLLEAPDELEFITCDQPVINTYAVFNPSDVTENDEFYYPVSPRRAVILSEHASYHGLHGTKLSALRVHYLNDLIAKAAYEQRFASRRASLEAYDLKAR